MTSTVVLMDLFMLDFLIGCLVVLAVVGLCLRVIEIAFQILAIGVFSMVLGFIMMIYFKGLMIEALALLAGLALLLFYLKSPHFKGKLGEFQVNRILNKTFKNKEAKILHDVTLPTKKGTTQIDHIVIIHAGIFVIETKNYSGEILGYYNNYKWKQILGNNEYTFYNPVMQNQKHINSLSETLNIEDNIFFNLVVFLKAKLPNIYTPNKTYSDVIKINELKEKLEGYEESLLSSHDINRLYTCIENNRLPRGYRTNRLHKINIRKYSSEQSD